MNCKKILLETFGKNLTKVPANIYAGMVQCVQENNPQTKQEVVDCAREYFEQIMCFYFCENRYDICAPLVDIGIKLKKKDDDFLEEDFFAMLLDAGDEVDFANPEEMQNYCKVLAVVLSNKNLLHSEHSGLTKEEEEDLNKSDLLDFFVLRANKMPNSSRKMFLNVICAFDLMYDAEELFERLVNCEDYLTELVFACSQNLDRNEQTLAELLFDYAQMPVKEDEDEDEFFVEDKQDKKEQLLARLFNEMADKSERIVGEDSDDFEGVFGEFWEWLNELNAQMSSKHGTIRFDFDATETNENLIDKDEELDEDGFKK